MNIFVVMLFAILLAVTSILAQSRAASGDVEPSGSTYSKGNFSRPSGERKVADLRVIKVGPPTTYLKNGLSIDEVTRLLGKPVYIAERQERNELVNTYIFRRGEDRFVVAEFAKGILKRSSVRSRVDLPLEKDLQSDKQVEAKLLRRKLRGQ